MIQKERPPIRSPFVDDRRRRGFHVHRGSDSWNRQGPPASFSTVMPVGLSCLCSRNILLHDRCMPPPTAHARVEVHACSPTSPIYRIVFPSIRIEQYRNPFDNFFIFRKSRSIEIVWKKEICVSPFLFSFPSRTSGRCFNTLVFCGEREISTMSWRKLGEEVSRREGEEEEEERGRGESIEKCRVDLWSTLGDGCLAEIKGENPWHVAHRKEAFRKKANASPIFTRDNKDIRN